jgi:OPA family sugar phosphate sensor protein UhpC-like MFS transporter
MNVGFLKAQPRAKMAVPAGEVNAVYKHWRVRTMYAMFVGYAVYYFCRKNLSAATPDLLADLGYTKTQLGVLWSALYLTYGISKFVMGIVGDRSNPRYFMAIGIFLSAICNIFFGMSSSLWMLGIFWALNGWVQGMGWPPCARLLTHWYSAGERGTWWGIWNSAHQVGGALILVIGGYLTQHYGWRSAMVVPAFAGILVAFFLVNRLRDTPESMGLPSIEAWRNDHTHAENEAKLDEKHPVKDILFNQVLNNPLIWFLSIGNFFVYLVRYGAMDWAPTFLVEVKQSSIAGASVKTAGFEIIGITGAFFAGWASDRFLKGRRAPLNVAYMLILAFAVFGFWKIPPGHPWLDAALLSAVGFLVYGPQMLVGVSAADVVSKSASATATGFTGLWGYIGSIASGVGTGMVVDHFGWTGGFMFFIAASILGAICFMATLRN